MLAIAGLYILASADVIPTGEPLNTKNKENTRFAIDETDHDTARPIAPHLTPIAKAKMVDKEVNKPQKKYRPDWPVDTIIKPSMTTMGDTRTENTRKRNIGTVSIHCEPKVI